MSCLRYLRFEGVIYGKLPNCMVKLKRLETLDISNSFIKPPTGVWKSTQLRHLRYEGFDNNVQTLMWMDDKFFEPRLLHRLINLKKLGIVEVSDSTIKILSTLNPVPTALEVLKLRFSMDMSEQINLLSYPNIVKLHLTGRMPLNCESFPPNLVKLTLIRLMVDGHVVAVLKKLPKLRILKMCGCIHHEEKMDLSGDGDGDCFLQLEVLHIEDASGLSEVTCRNDVSMPKLKKLLLIGVHSLISLSERLAKLRV